MQVQGQIDSISRRRVPKAADRTSGRITAMVKTSSSMREYDVAELSVAGATLEGGSRLPERAVVQVVLRIPLYPEIRVPARVLRSTTSASGGTRVVLSFKHQTDRTEDHIQAALLSELERSHRHMVHEYS